MLLYTFHLQGIVYSCNWGHYETIPMAVALSMSSLSQRVPVDIGQEQNLHILHQVGSF